MTRFYPLFKNTQLYILCVIIDARVTGDWVTGDRGMDGGDTRWGEYIYLYFNALQNCMHATLGIYFYRFEIIVLENGNF